MARHQKRTFGEVTIAGANVKIGAVTTSALLRNNEDKIALCTGATKPTDAGAGYASGCMFIKSDGTVYFNVGTKTSCNFDLGAVGDNLELGGVTGIGLKINKLANTGETIKAHCHQAVDGLEQANEFKGESLSTTGGMTGIVSDFIMAASGTASITGIMGIAHLLGGITSTGGNVIGVSGGADVVGTINGADICVAGVVGGLMPQLGGTLTLCKYFSAIWASCMAVQVPTTGQSQLLLMTNGLGATLNQAIYIDASDRISEFAHFANCATMISAKTDADVAYAHYRKLLVTVDSLPGWIYIEMAA